SFPHYHLTFNFHLFHFLQLHISHTIMFPIQLPHFSFPTITYLPHLNRFLTISTVYTTFGLSFHFSLLSSSYPAKIRIESNVITTRYSYARKCDFDRLPVLQFRAICAERFGI